jgi:hypothetical protein
MSEKTKIFLLRLATIIGAMVFGLFIGLIILGTILRVVLDLLFNWGDTGPEWVNYVILFLTLLSIIISCTLFLKGTNSFLKR